MLTVWQRNIVQSNGDVVSGATVAVYRESDAALATLYDNPEGTGTPLANPLTADVNGFVRFYTEAGAHRIVATSGAFSATWRHETFGDAQNYRVGVELSDDIPTTGMADERYLLQSQNLSDLDDASAARDNLGLGSAATFNEGTGTGELTTVDTVEDIITAAVAGLGAIFQPLDADLTSIASLAGVGFGVRTDVDTWLLRSIEGSDRISVTDGDGIDANPVLDLVPLTINRALVSDPDGFPAASSVTSTELGYLAGAIAPIQTQFAGVASTGVVYGGALSINADPTKFDCSAIRAVFITHANPTDTPTITYVTTSAFTAQTVTNIATQPITYLALDINGVIQQFSTPLTATQRRQYAEIGALIHTGFTVIIATNAIISATGHGVNQLHDFMEALGPLNLSGNKYSANGANLNIDVSAGVLFKMGANFHNNEHDPHKLSLSSGTAITFRYRRQNSAEGSDVTAIDPNNYDVGGTITAVPTNKFTVQLISRFQSGLTRIQYGQTVYNSLAEAIAGIQTEAFVVEPNIAENGVSRCRLVVKQGTTNLQSATDAQFFEIPKFGGSPSGSGTIAGTVNLAAGTVAAPSLYWDINSTTGFYQIAANNIGFTVSGTKVLDISAGKLGIPAGAVGAPSLYLSTDTTTGLYRIGANNVGVAVSGAKVLDIASTGLGVTGSVFISENISVGVARDAAIGAYISNSALTGVTQIGAYIKPVASSAATTYIGGIFVNAGTANSAFTCANSFGVYVENPTKGAASTITSATGVYVDNISNGGSNNYGVSINVSSGATKWNLYAAGTAKNYFNGTVLIGTTTDNGTDKLQVNGSANISGNAGLGGTTAANVRLYLSGGSGSNATWATMQFNTTISGSTVTQYYGALISGGTAATAFTLADARQLQIDNLVKGAGSAITTQTGVYIANLSSGATNYGISSNVTAGATNWNLYVAGTAKNHFAGNVLVGTTSDNGEKLYVSGTALITSNVGIGTSTNSARNLEINKQITGATTAYGLSVTGFTQTGVTANSICIYAGGATVASSFTCASTYGLYVDTFSLGAGSTVTTNTGVFVGGQTAGTTNYGVRSAISAGANNWNLYFDGAAKNHMAGALLIGTTTDDGTNKLQVNGNGIRISTAQTPASAAAAGTQGTICWDSSFIYVCTATNTWKRAAIATW